MLEPPLEDLKSLLNTRISTEFSLSKSHRQREISGTCRVTSFLVPRFRVILIQC